MAQTIDVPHERRGRRLRIAAWTGAGALLLVPLIAMQFTREVNWTPADFAVAGGLIVGAGIAYELAVRRTHDGGYRAAGAVALATAFILVWVNLAVGIIGAENNPANLMFGGVLAIGIVSASIVRFEPHGLARVLIAMALAQMLVGGIALIAGLEALYVIAPVTAFFAGLWLVSAGLFVQAARRAERIRR